MDITETSKFEEWLSIQVMQMIQRNSHIYLKKSYPFVIIIKIANINYLIGCKKKSAKKKKDNQIDISSAFL